VATGLTASAASIEQIMNFTVVGWYQGVSTNNGVVVRDRTQIVRFTSENLVHALAIDYDTNYFTGQLLYQEVLDDSNTVVQTNVVIRQHGKTNELNVTSNFTFVTGPFVIAQIANTNRLITNSYVETGLRSVSFTSSSVSFTNNGGFSTGSLKRSKKLANIHGSGYADLLSYSGGGGTFVLNTNLFHMTNFQFEATNTVGGPAQINFSTFSPSISTIIATNPPSAPSSPANPPDSLN
jgi:hypothetical protein